MDPASHAPGRVQRRLGALCWLLTLPYFAVEPIVAAAWDGPPYSYIRDTISILGITTCVPAPDMPMVIVCSPRHGIMNAAFVALGLLTLAGAVLLRSQWPRRGMTTAGLALLVTASVSTVATGLFPADLDVAAHAVASLPQFLLQNVGMLLLGIAGWGSDRSIAVSSLLCATMGLAGMILFVGAVPWGLPQGALERLTLYPLSVWPTIVAVAALWHQRTAPPSSPRPIGAHPAREVR